MWKWLLTACIMAAWPYAVQAQQPQNIPGRYQIVMNPTIPRFSFLLDTETGSVWQLMQFNDRVGDPLAWEAMSRLQSPEDFRQFYASHIAKTPEQMRPQTPQKPLQTPLQPTQPLQPAQH